MKHLLNVTPASPGYCTLDLSRSRLCLFLQPAASRRRSGERRGCSGGPGLGPKGRCGFKCAPCAARAAIALMQSDRDRCDISVPTHFHTTSHRLGVTHIPLLWSCPPAAGQHDDARMNLAITRTAARYGAAIANYTEVVHLVKGAEPQTGWERVRGARCEDAAAGKPNKSCSSPACRTGFLSLALPALSAGLHIVIAHLIQGILIFYKHFMV